MGKLMYPQNVNIEFEDRLLAHLEIVIEHRIANGDNFSMLATMKNKLGEERLVTVILGPGIPIVFEIDAKTDLDINDNWVSALAANSPLRVVPEPVKSGR